MVGTSLVFIASARREKGDVCELQDNLEDDESEKCLRHRDVGEEGIRCSARASCASALFGDCAGFKAGECTGEPRSMKPEPFTSRTPSSSIIDECKFSMADREESDWSSSAGSM